MTTRLPASQPFEVRRSPIAGLGAFATRRIRKGTRLIEYLGERISTDEADARYDDDAQDQHHTVLFSVDDETVIDAAVGGNDARFINHACAPNCEAVNEEGRIFIEAIADIAPGVELVYDYSLTRDEPWDESWAELYACRCGAATCRGTLLASPKPPKKAASKRAASKRAASKRAASKKPASKKPASKKAASKKPASKRSRGKTTKKGK